MRTNPDRLATIPPWPQCDQADAVRLVQVRLGLTDAMDPAAEAIDQSAPLPARRTSRPSRDVDELIWRIFALPAGMLVGATLGGVRVHVLFDRCSP